MGRLRLSPSLWVGLFAPSATALRAAARAIVAVAGTARGATVCVAHTCHLLSIRDLCPNAYLIGGIGGVGTMFKWWAITQTLRYYMPAGMDGLNLG